MRRTRIQIRSPIWGRQEVGIAEYRMYSEILEVEITYRDKKGRRIYPNLYRIERRQALSYPRKCIHGCWLRIIPLADFMEVVSEYNP
ncbi:hypothetical protein ES703_120467 [subsurface metagenome]